jgi:hypothetical protein
MAPTVPAARAIAPTFRLEYCPCGGVITAWIAPDFSMTSTSDPDIMAYLCVAHGGKGHLGAQVRWAHSQC